MPAARFVVEPSTLFLGRTFAEYARMFDLDPATLRDRSVLDCPGGPSSFVAVLASIGGTCRAVDLQYGPGAETLESRCQDAIERTMAQLREKRDLFVLDEYGDVETRGRYLRAAAERFLADYAHHPGRYLPGALPDVPFAGGEFDLVLSGNFLFLYDDRLDRDFHLAALRELCRVGGEVRVFPLSSLDRTRSALVEPVVEDLRAEGYAAAFRSVPYEFQPGATEMLVVRE